MSKMRTMRGTETTGRRLLLVLGVVALILVLVVAFSWAMLARSGDSSESLQSVSLDPGESDSGNPQPPAPRGAAMPYVPYTPIMGESVSREEAARLSPFPIVFPEIPGGLSLADIRHYTVGSTRHYFILIYSHSPLPENPNLWSLLYSGGMIVIQGQHGFPDHYIEGLIEETERTSGSSVEAVDGNTVMMTEGDLKDEAVFYRGGVIFDVVAGPDTGIDQLRAVISSITTQLGPEFS
jgi:hypothetical protein